MPHDCVECFSKSIVNLAVSELVKKHWTQHIVRGYKEALAALLLAHLPCLATLKIWTQDQFAPREYSASQFLLQGKPFWTLIMPQPEKGALRTPFLSNVRTLNLLSLPCPVYELASVFTLPALQALHIWDVVDKRQYQELLTWAFIPQSNKILTLELTSAALTMETLCRMLLSCATLESFTYNCPTAQLKQNLNTPD